jgi:hypothetical protein
MKTIRTNCQTLSFTTKVKGQHRVPSRSGLNWGQRPGRNENQAYIAVPAYVQRSGFFPVPATEFLLEWDDGTIHTCVRAQQNGKAIQTPENNAILGTYLRTRLSVESGDPIVLSHLLRYGRTDVEIFKDSENHYYADFSRPKNI